MRISNIYFNTFSKAYPEKPEYRVRKDEPPAGLDGEFSGHAQLDGNPLQLAKKIINSYLTFTAARFRRHQRTGYTKTAYFLPFFFGFSQKPEGSVHFR